MDNSPLILLYHATTTNRLATVDCTSPVNDVLASEVTVLLSEDKLCVCSCVCGVHVYLPVCMESA